MSSLDTSAVDLSKIDEANRRTGNPDYLNGPTPAEVEEYLDDLQQAAWPYVRTLIANGRIGGAYRELMTSFEHQCRVAGIPFSPDPSVVPTAFTRLVVDKRARDAARRAGGAR